MTATLGALLGTASPMMWAGLSLGLLATGALAGLAAGLLGVGGGLVVVPVLMSVFAALDVDPAVRMHLAVGTSLAAIVPTSWLSARAHHARHHLDPQLLRRLLPGVFLGVLLGALLSRVLSGAVLVGVFAVVALAVSLQMGLQRQPPTLRDGLPGPLGTGLLGSLIGGVATLMGIGGGTLSVPLLSALRVPMHVAVGTGAALGMAISLPGALGAVLNGLDVPGRPPLSLGYVNLLGLALIVPATWVTTRWGAHLAAASDPRRLRQVFALVLALTALRMLSTLQA